MKNSGMGGGGIIVFFLQDKHFFPLNTRPKKSDFCIRVLAAGGGEGPQVEDLVLAELKVISCCPTRYQRDPRATVKAVDQRVVTLPNEYR